MKSPRLARRHLLALALCTAPLSLLSAPPHAAAHHSFAMFDFKALRKLRGVVEEFRWTNPHVVLVVKSEAEAGKKEEGARWALELTSPGNLTRTGWNRKAFQPGDAIEVEFNPLRDGGHGGAFKRATVLATGKVWETNLRAQERPGLE
jgi:Family of unknown function (DUF6152)